MNDNEYTQEDAVIDMSFIEAMLGYREEEALAAQKWSQLDVYDLELDIEKIISRLHNVLKYIIPDEERETSNNPSEAERSEEPKE